MNHKDITLKQKEEFIVSREQDLNTKEQDLRKREEEMLSKEGEEEIKINEDELFQITQEGAKIIKDAIAPFFESANARQELVEAQLEETFKDLQIARMEIDKVEEEKRVLQEEVDIFT